MADIIKEVLGKLDESKISDAAFEGANIVLYTKDKDFFLHNKGEIKRIVDEIKKRVELRPDPSITMDIEDAESQIKKIIPEEAGVEKIQFDPQRSMVIIETDKPGLAIGKRGENLKQIREVTSWVPLIKRTPAIESKLIDNIRSVLYQESDYRRKFLDKTGHRIYDGWLRGKKKEWIRLSVLGGGRQVGRSCMLLQTPESRVLLDCGVDVANTGEPYPYLEVPEFNIKDLDAVIISHSHLDHVGFLPYLFKYGYRGPVYCTAPTRDVASLLLLDYVKIMRSEGEDPIFTTEEIKEMVKHTITLDYEEVTDITPDVRITLYNAGHIIGSAMVHLHVGNGHHNILYTGDVKFGRTTLLETAATKFPRLETLIIEGTYGGKRNVLPSKKKCDMMLGEYIGRTLKRGGKVLIPVLGSGRAQEVMLIIENLVRQGMLDRVPVFIDGMVWDITAIHTAYPEFLNGRIRKQIFHRDRNPFLSDIFKQVGSSKERKKILEEVGPCVILATSGMLVGGPSVEYFKAMAGDPKNTLVFVSYQGVGSLGRRVQRGEKQFAFRVNNSRQDIVEVQMDVETIEGFTGHSGRKQLMNFVHKCSPRPKKVIIVHSENSRSLDLASSLHKSMRIETVAPRNLESVRIR